MSVGEPRGTSASTDDKAPARAAAATSTMMLAATSTMMLMKALKGSFMTGQAWNGSRKSSKRRIQRGVGQAEEPDGWIRTGAAAAFTPQQAARRLEQRVEDYNALQKASGTFHRAVLVLTLTPEFDPPRGQPRVMAQQQKLDRVGVGERGQGAHEARAGGAVAL